MNFDHPDDHRELLRTKPDVLLIGEMRDPAEITAILTAAKTGVLVYTTMNSRSVNAFERFADRISEALYAFRVWLRWSIRAIFRGGA
jgi:Tfp pilus assembly pilus retraction ATPase PilT